MFREAIHVCPACRVPLIGSAEAPQCPNCRGVLVDRDAMHRRVVDVAPDLAARRVDGVPSRGTSLGCPACRRSMQAMLLYREACHLCRSHGYWLVAGSIERIIELARARYAERGSRPRPAPRSAPARTYRSLEERVAIFTGRR